MRMGNSYGMNCADNDIQLTTHRTQYSKIENLYDTFIGIHKTQIVVCRKDIVYFY